MIKILATIAKQKIRQHKPKIIAVTGSVGKTSTRTAIAIALAAKYRVRTPYKNYNNEFGLPLAILGEQSPGKNLWGWMKLVVRAYKTKDMPEYLVLEYGADRPGDIGFLTNIAKPDVAVITAVSAVHLANYPSWEALVSEKASLGLAVPSDGLVVLNADDQAVASMQNRYQAPVVLYGFRGGEAVASELKLFTAQEESFDIGEAFAITKAKISYKGDVAELALTNCVSPTLVASCTAAMVVAEHFGISLAVSGAALSKELQPVNGRLRPLPGIKGSLIIDDSYNAAPASVTAALEALNQFEPGEERDRRIAVLGDMAELGPRTEQEHRAIGRKVAQVADLFVAIGANMRLAGEAAVAAGMAEDKIKYFANSVEAGDYLDPIVKTGDVILVKGSQSMRTERVVKALMAEPQRATELLVRQERYWLNRR